MYKRINKMVVLFAAMLPMALFAEGFHPTLSLTFDKDPVCQVEGKKDIKSSGDLTYDDENIAWTSQCSIKVGKVKHCVMMGQSVSNPDAISMWEVNFSGDTISAKMVSDADINQNFGKLMVKYYCH